MPEAHDEAVTDEHKQAREDNIAVSQTSTSLPGIVRNYTSIKKAMRDNCMSRVYVGYHFRKGVMEGEKQGVNLGHYVFENSFKEK